MLLSLKQAFAGLWELGGLACALRCLCQLPCAGSILGCSIGIATGKLLRSGKSCVKAICMHVPVSFILTLCINKSRGSVGAATA